MLSKTLLDNSQDVDPSYNDVVLLLHADGTEGSTNFLDSSPKHNSITSYGSARITNTQGKFGGSAYFDGVNSYLSVPPTNFNFGSNDFTVELFFYRLSTPSGCCLISDRYTGAGDTITFAIGFSNTTGATTSGSNIFFGIGDPSGGWYSTYMSSLLSNNQWYHVAGVKSGNSISLFVGGILVSTKTIPITNVMSPTEIFVGRRWDTGSSTSFFNGYIDEVRVTNGVARYTTDFTPPTLPFS